MGSWEHFGALTDKHYAEDMGLNPMTVSSEKAKGRGLSPIAWQMPLLPDQYASLLINIFHFLVFISHFLTHTSHFHTSVSQFLRDFPTDFPFLWWTSDKPQWLRGNIALDSQLSLALSDLWTLGIALHSFWSHSYIFKKYMWFQTFPYFPRIKQLPQSSTKQVSWECSLGFNSWSIILAKQKQF